MRLLPHIAVVWLSMGLPSALAWSQSTKHSSDEGEKSRVAFDAAQDSFWKAQTPERGIVLRDQESLRPRNVKLYRVAADRADEFLQLTSSPRSRRIEIRDVEPQGDYKPPRNGVTPQIESGPMSSDWRVPAALYYSALSHSWLEENGSALVCLDRLLEEYPDYQRPQVPRFPKFKRPAKFELLQLKLYHLTHLSALEKVPGYVAPYLQADCTFQTLQIAADTARLSIDRRKEWGEFVKANSPNEKPRNELEIIFYTPDARRTLFLPPLQDSLARIYNNLLPTALQISGVKGVASFLRQFQKPGHPFRWLLQSPVWHKRPASNSQCMTHPSGR